MVRSCNRNQTIGIPIGPETSRIIAEIISSRIDSDFQKKLPDIPNESIDRLQDDWFIGVNTLEKAETALSTVTTIYREYGLEINGTKTSIDRIISSSESTWISEISAFLSHKSGVVRGARLRELLSLSLRLQTQYPNEPVINYSLSVIEGQNIAKIDAEVLESFLLKAAVTSPISMDRICQITLNLQHQTKIVSRKRIGQRFTQLAERNLENGNIYEVIWLLYTLRGLQIPLSSKLICQLVESISSSALALILLDMDSKNLCRYKLPKAMWANLITKKRVKSDWTWLLGYEGIRHGWLPDNSNVMNDAFFDAMAKRNVVFYDPKRNVQQSSKVVQKRKQSRKLQLLIMQKFIQNLRGFEFDEYWGEY